MFFLYSLCGGFEQKIPFRIIRLKFSDLFESTTQLRMEKSQEIISTSFCKPKLMVFESFTFSVILLYFHLPHGTIVTWDINHKKMIFFGMKLVKFVYKIRWLEVSFSFTRLLPSTRLDIFINLWTTRNFHCELGTKNHFRMLWLAMGSLMIHLLFTFNHLLIEFMTLAWTLFLSTTNSWRSIISFSFDDVQNFLDHIIQLVILLFHNNWRQRI